MTLFNTFILFSLCFEYFQTYKKLQLYLYFTVKIKFYKDKVNIPSVRLWP